MLLVILPMPDTLVYTIQHILKKCLHQQFGVASAGPIPRNLMVLTQATAILMGQG